MRVDRYKKEHESQWNGFLPLTKNHTFMFHRAYMEYHQDRFQDHSLLVFDEKDKLLAIFPANESNGELISHGGLSFGGIIVQRELKLSVYVPVFAAILKYAHETGFSTVKIKIIPGMYSLLPSEEIHYCLQVTEASVYRRDVALVVDRLEKIKIAGNVRREGAKAIKNGYTFQEETNFTRFWDEILSPNLNEKYGVNPVHTVQEMQQLHKNFSENIRLFCVYNDEGQMVAGTVFFITDQVVHCQYISSSTEGRNSGALNMLFIELIEHLEPEKRYFDLGTVNVGGKMNKGLLFWKEKVGGRAFVHDFYSVKTENHIHLEDHNVYIQ